MLKINAEGILCDDNGEPLPRYIDTGNGDYEVTPGGETLMWSDRKRVYASDHGLTPEQVAILQEWAKKGNTFPDPDEIGDSGL